MKYIDVYRDVKKCRKVAAMINGIARARRYKIMEVCGTHTAAIRKFGIREMLPPSIDLISGPGCPVCVTSDGYLENAARLSRDPRVTIVTYHDMLRVPVKGTTLEQERANGADVRGVISALEAVDLAKEAPAREVVFLGVGFETTAPGTALAVKLAARLGIRNFSVYSAHKTVPEALDVLGRQKDLALDGFLLPGHVSAVIGVRGYERILRKMKKPCVISGFEALDILVSLYELIRAVNRKDVVLENEYTRIVRRDGNPRARAMLNEIFQKEDAVWRGLGMIPESGLGLRKRFKDRDAARRFALPKERVCPSGGRGCRCADVLKGKIKPPQCPLFSKACVPGSPIGPCMVSREGTCRSYYEYR